MGLFTTNRGKNCKNKTRYSSDAAAQEALKRINPLRAANKPRRVYKCTDCAGWHLSSKPKL